MTPKNPKKKCEHEWFDADGWLQECDQYCLNCLIQREDSND